jgi:hypothetical protein
MAITCDPSQLANASVCFFECIPNNMQAAVQTYLLAYLLNQLTGTTSMDPKVLLAAATAQGNSYLILEGVQQEVQAYLLCQLATAAGA